MVKSILPLVSIEVCLICFVFSFAIQLKYTVILALSTYSLLF